MPLPSSGNLETLDYAFDGQAFDYLGKVGTQSLDYAFDGQPFYGTQTTQNISQSVSATASSSAAVGRGVGTIKTAFVILPASLLSPATYFRTITSSVVHASATMITLLKLAIHQISIATSGASTAVFKRVGKILRAK